jgi:hypothetical protein
MTKPANALETVQRLGHGLAQYDADILDRMVKINMQIALGLDAQVKAAVPGKGIEHMVEKPDPGRDLGLASAIQINRDLDLGLLGFAKDLRGSVLCHHNILNQSPA